MNQTIKGLKQGPWESYFADGKLADKGSFLNNQTYGYWEFFWENGNPQWSGYYDMHGELIGFWLEYDNDGDVEGKEFFL